MLVTGVLLQVNIEGAGRENKTILFRIRCGMFALPQLFACGSYQGWCFTEGFYFAAIIGNFCKV
jgi:hypothetical protein